MSNIAVINKDKLEKKFVWMFLELTQTCLQHPYPWKESLGLISELAGDVYFTERTPELESDETKLQLVVYCLVKTSDGYLTYRRKGAEGRLHGLRSIGFGGHVEDGDGSVEDIITVNLHKEMTEELPDLHLTDNTIEFVGLLHNPSTPVGRVHLGLVYLVDIGESLVGYPIIESSECGTVTCQKFEGDDYEPWSVDAHAMVEDYLLTKAKAKSIFEGTLVRNVGSPYVYSSPERDLAVVASSALDELAVALFTRNWANLDDLMYAEDPRLAGSVELAMQQLNNILQIAINRDSAIQSFSDACLSVDWFAIPVRARAVIMSNFGLLMLAKTWVFLRQYVAMGHDVTTDFRETSKAAGRYVTGLMGDIDASTTVASIVRVAKEGGIDVGRLVSMVEQAYRTEK